MITLKNKSIEVAIAEHGAELSSIRCGGEELVWCADKAYWGRHAPILFPIVGKVWNDEYRVEGKTYHLGQHGFARDSEFEVVAAQKTEATLVLRSSEATLKQYPYSFELTAHYVLEGSTLTMEWTVANGGDGRMYYQIGAHPAFLFKDFDAAEECHGFVQLLRSNQGVGQVEVAHLNEQGGVADDRKVMQINSGLLPLTDQLFAGDALIMEHSQVDGALLLDKSQKPYLRVDFEGSPVLGIWSPKGKKAPFVCIEPWKGRADGVGFDGDISERQWINCLEKGAQQTFRYTVTLL